METVESGKPFNNGVNLRTGLHKVGAYDTEHDGFVWF